jgi:hypothetical protein
MRQSPSQLQLEDQKMDFSDFERITLSYVVKDGERDIKQRLWDAEYVRRRFVIERNLTGGPCRMRRLGT